MQGRDVTNLERELESAEANYRLLKENNVRAISVMGALGSGKTSLIERMITRLKPCGTGMGTICADSAGDDDNQRFLACGVQSVQVNTKDNCCLDAPSVKLALQSLSLETIDLLFIENVGNLICPADFPVGAELELIVISVSEGETVIRKHPKIFSQTDLVVVNKIDLADAVNVNPRIIVADYAQLNPHGKVILADVFHNRGINALLQALKLECATEQW